MMYNVGDIVGFKNAKYQSSQGFDFVGIVIGITHMSHSEMHFSYVRVLNNKGKTEIWPSINLVRY